MFSKSSILIVVPTPNPIPPGVDGLCPIIVDSVIIVSVIVSIATSPITGAASFILKRSKSSIFIETLPNACLSESITPSILSLVPFIPVVFTMPLDKNSIFPSS